MRAAANASIQSHFYAFHLIRLSLLQYFFFFFFAYHENFTAKEMKWVMQISGRDSIFPKKKKKTNYWEQRGQCNVRELETFTGSTDAAVSVFYWFRTSEVFTNIHFHLCSNWSACAVTQINFSPPSLFAIFWFRKPTPPPTASSILLHYD